MATDTTTTSSTLEDLWDKFTDGLTAASDGVSRGI